MLQNYANIHNTIASIQIQMQNASSIGAGFFYAFCILKSPNVNDHKIL